MNSTNRERPPLSERALGLVETRGLIGAIEAADAMVKAAKVTLLDRELSSGAMVTIKVIGETGAVRAALDAGAKAAERVGELIATHMIPRPHDEVEDVLVYPGCSSSEFTRSSGSKAQKLDGITVKELRARARHTKNFPLTGRDISTADKHRLLKIFKDLEA